MNKDKIEPQRFNGKKLALRQTVLGSVDIHLIQSMTETSATNAM